MGLLTTVFLLSTISIYELNTIYRLYNEHRNSKIELVNIGITLLVGLYILVNVVANMYLTMSTDTTIYAIRHSLPNSLLSEWSYCHICELNTPPRAHHCIICQKCILKRQSHCMFLGKCCGLLNARYYYFFLVYLWLGSLFCNYLNLEYFIDIMHNGLNLKTMFSTFMPMLAWLFGIVDNMRLFTVFINTVCMLSFLLLSVFIVINFRLVYSGQTWYENAKNNHQYDLGLYENFIQVFGLNWFRAFIWPFAAYRLENDGITYRKNKIIANSGKNI